MNLHLLIPSLFFPQSAGAEVYGGLALPALEALLARGELSKSPGTTLERWLAAAFRVSPQYDLPLAAPSLRGDGVDPGVACWLQADPVHLKVQRDQLMLADASCFEITAEEAADMRAALNAHFLQDGLEFVSPVPQRWYARLRAEARIRTTPTVEVAGRSIERFLPVGDDAPRWRRLANEAQMLLHQQPCNEAREKRGELPVNSVWFWGAGRMPEVARDPPYGAVWSGHPLAAGLAAAARLRVRALPRSGTELLETRGDAARNPHELVVIDWLRGAACNDVQPRRKALMLLEELWFAPLLDGLKRKILRSVTLHVLGPEHSLTSISTRLDHLKFWRMRRPLADYLPAVSG